MYVGTMPEGRKDVHVDLIHMCVEGTLVGYFIGFLSDPTEMHGYLTSVFPIT